MPVSEELIVSDPLMVKCGGHSDISEHSTNHDQIPKKPWKLK